MARVGLIGGTGALQFAPLAAAAETCEIKSRYSDEPVLVTEWRWQEHEVFFLLRHGPDSLIPPHKVNYRANIDAFRRLEVDWLVSMNAVGGITTDGEAGLPGTLVIPDQIVDYTWGREHTYFDAEANELEHLEFTQPFSQPLRHMLLTAAAGRGVNVRSSGVYGVTQGPRLETAAEVDKLERDGCDIVGMTVMPEAALAAEAGLEYASLSGVVNHAAGRGGTAGEGGSIHDQIEAHVTACMAQSRAILEELLAELG